MSDEKTVIIDPEQFSSQNQFIKLLVSELGLPSHFVTNLLMLGNSLQDVSQPVDIIALGPFDDLAPWLSAALHIIERAAKNNENIRLIKY